MLTLSKYSFCNVTVLDNDEYVNYINQYPSGLISWQFNNSIEIGNIVKEYYFGDKRIDPKTKMQFSNVSQSICFFRVYVSLHSQYFRIYTFQNCTVTWIIIIIIIEVKTSLGAWSKNFVGIELDWRVTLVQVKSAQVTAI